MIPHKLSKEELRLQTDARRGADHPLKGSEADSTAARGTKMPLENDMPNPPSVIGADKFYKPTNQARLEAEQHHKMPPGSSNAVLDLRADGNTISKESDSRGEK